MQCVCVCAWVGVRMCPCFNNLHKNLHKAIPCSKAPAVHIQIQVISHKLTGVLGSVTLWVGGWVCIHACVPVCMHVWGVGGGRICMHCLRACTYVSYVCACVCVCLRVLGYYRARNIQRCTQMCAWTLCMCMSVHACVCKSEHDCAHVSVCSVNPCAQVSSSSWTCLKHNLRGAITLKPNLLWHNLTGDSLMTLLFLSICSGVLAPTMATGTDSCWNTQAREAAAMSSWFFSQIPFSLFMACEKHPTPDPLTIRWVDILFTIFPLLAEYSSCLSLAGLHIAAAWTVLLSPAKNATTVIHSDGHLDTQSTSREQNTTETRTALLSPAESGSV